MDALKTFPDITFPIGEWERPKDLMARYKQPPFAVVRPYPSAAQFNGPLSQTQADIVLRVQVIAVGKSEFQALRVGDLCRMALKRSRIIVTGRYVQDFRFMVAAGGVTRDDDLPTPFFSASDLYELATTPAET